MPLVAIARAAEERGLKSLYLPEHTHIPVGSDEVTGPDGAPIPRRYRRVLSPIVALSWLAARCELEMGTAVCLPAEHDPIVFAKEIATLDFLSGGRLLLGVGFGWNRPEAANHISDARRRADVAIRRRG